MIFEGELGTEPLPRVLQRISERRRTGILTIQGEADIVAVSFLSGEIVSADALNQTVEDGLGEVLASQGLVSPEAFEAAAAEHQGGSGGTLGDLLVSRGTLTREQLLAGLRQQTAHLMQQLLSWQQGEFKFYDGDEVSYEEGITPIVVEELLARSIENAGDLGGLSALPSVSGVYRRCDHGPEVRVIGVDRVAAGADGEEVWLTAGEAGLYRACDGELSAAAAGGGLGRYKLVYGLHRLLDLGLIEPVPVVGGIAQRVGAVEIFMPPDPDAAVVPESRPADRALRWLSWLGRILAAAAAAALIAALVAEPSALSLPAPWQASQRGAAERQQRQALFQKIDRAARTFFLMENRYPESLIELVDLDLLTARDLRDPGGRTLSYSVDQAGYSISLRGSVGKDGEEPVDLRAGAISGDPLLDAEIAVRDESGVAPVYLID